jgi:hypothetical protein
MKRTLMALMAVSGIALAMPVYADDDSNVKTQEKIEKGSDGSYSEKGSSSSSGTDANGTYTSEDKSINTKIDANGNGSKTVKTTAVNDPKGLFNKTKTVTTDTQKYKGDATETDHEKTVNGRAVEKSSVTTTDNR